MTAVANRDENAFTGCLDRAARIDLRLVDRRYMEGVGGSPGLRCEVVGVRGRQVHGGRHAFGHRHSKSAQLFGLVGVVA